VSRTADDRELTVVTENRPINKCNSTLKPGARDVNQLTAAANSKRFYSYFRVFVQICEVLNGKNGVYSTRYDFFK
jgi:hypothetical protein